MAVKALTLTLAAGAKQLNLAYPAPPAGVTAAQQDISYRQLVLTTTGATAYLGDATVSTTTGVAIATTTAPFSLGPFTAGAVKLSDLYAVGAGATLQILGVPF